MLCSYCNAPRIANEAPCPHCGAHLPLPKAPVGNIWGSTNVTGSTAAGSDRSGTSRKTSPNFQRRNSGTVSRTQQLNFSDAGHSGNSERQVPKPPFETHNSISAQAQPVQSVEPAETQSTDRRQALLPVPYQEM